MKRLVDDLQYNFKKQNNGLIQLILINVVVFVLMGIVYVVSKFAHADYAYYFWEKHTHLPAKLNEFIVRPWTLITYFFSHAFAGFLGIMHILWNMLGLYWFGKIIHEYIGNRRLINIYLLGGIVGGVIYLLLFNLVPFFIAKQPILGLVGASGAVFAVAVAAATLVPDYTFYLLFFGPVRIIYIVAIFVFVSFLGTVGDNAGGDICHLGGALLGYIYIIQLRKGRDIGQPINVIAAFFQRLRSPRRNLKVSYRKKEDEEISQKDIDAILDKINRSGYNSLTKEEKQKLYKASQK